MPDFVVKCDFRPQKVAILFRTSYIVAGEIPYPVSVAHGGTGSTNAAGARTALGALGASDIANNLTTDTEGKVLDARQGKALKDAVDAKVNTSDVIDDLVSTDTDKPLSAKQGKVLADRVTPVANGGTGSSSASGARTNLSVYSQAETDSAIGDATKDKAYKVVLTSAAHDTWAKVYAVLSALPMYETVTIYSGPTSTSMLTDGNITTNVAGTISRTGSNTVYMELYSGTVSYAVFINDMTSSSRTTRISINTRGSYYNISSTTTFAIPTSARLLMLVMDSVTSRCGLYFVVSTTSGSVTHASIGEGAGQMAITDGTNTITLTPSSGSRAILFIDAARTNALPIIAT